MTSEPVLGHKISPLFPELEVVESICDICGERGFAFKLKNVELGSWICKYCTHNEKMFDDYLNNLQEIGWDETEEPVI